MRNLEGKLGKKAPSPCELDPTAVWFGVSGQAPETLPKHDQPTSLKFRVELRRLIFSVEEVNSELKDILPEAEAASDGSVAGQKAFDDEGALVVIRVPLVECLGEFDPLSHSLYTPPLNFVMGLIKL